MSMPNSSNNVLLLRSVGAALILVSLALATSVYFSRQDFAPDKVYRVTQAEQQQRSAEAQTLNTEQLLALGLFVVGFTLLWYGGVPKRFRAVDVLYFVISLPVIVVTIHEYGICSLFPDLGFQDGDRCTLGWGMLLFVWPIIIHAIATIIIVPVRIIGLLRLGQQGIKTLVFYAIVIILTAPISLPAIWSIVEIHAYGILDNSVRGASRILTPSHA